MPLDNTFGEPGEEIKNNTNNNDNHYDHRNLIGQDRGQLMGCKQDGALERVPVRLKRRSSFRRQRLEHALSSEDESDFSETEYHFTDKPRYLTSSVQSPRDINTLPTEASHPHEQATLNSSSQKDATLHFDLDFADDIEGHLEELARLKRLGHFHDAVNYFVFNLKQHLSLPIVKIEYADLLQEQGAYRELLDLQSRGILKITRRMDPIHTPELYLWHLHIIQKCAKSAFEGLSKLDIREGMTQGVLEHVEIWLSLHLSDYLDQKPIEPVDWTELQVFRKLLYLLSTVYIKDVLPPHRPMWTAIYNDLLDSERIWDISDVIISMINVYDPHKVLIDLFNDPFDREAPEGDQGPLRRLLEDLESDKYDESTELAILSILVELAYAIESSSYEPENDYTVTAKRCLQHASDHARLIEEHSPELTRSRPYIMFVLAKERFNRHWNDHHSERQRPAVYAPGMTFGVGGMPSYIPIEAENPGWPSPDPKFPPNPALQGILRSARELGDYEVEAACLMELICRVEDPTSLLDQLGNLQKTTQGHYKSYIQTCISRYLLVKDKVSAQKLLGELEQSVRRLCSDPGMDAFPPFRWKELKVRYALHIQVSGHAREADQTISSANALLNDHRVINSVNSHNDHRRPQSSLYTRYARNEDYISPHQIVVEPSRYRNQDREPRETLEPYPSSRLRELRPLQNHIETTLQQDDRIPKLEKAVWEIKQQLERLGPGEQCTELVVTDAKQAAKDEHERGFNHVIDSNMVRAEDQDALDKQVQTQTEAECEKGMPFPQETVDSSGGAAVNNEKDETRSDHSLDC